MEKEWELPLKTDDIEMNELANRVKFESKDVVRFLTKNNRDILFKLDTIDYKTVHYLSEVRVEN